MSLGSGSKTVLVTGAAGFLGSHLVDRLLQEGYEVVGIDNLMTGDLTNLQAASKNPKFHFQARDVRSPINVYAEIIYNMACPASPVHYQHDPYATLTTSILGAMQIVEMARGKKCRIIHASTSEIYGDPQVHPQTEDYWGHVNPIGSRSCYDEGKRAAETMFMDARRTWGVDARIVRIFNTYGPRMAFNDGRVVSNFITQALENSLVTIFGDGKQTRSFCYVDDLIEGLVRIAGLDEMDAPMNLGNPHEVAVTDLAGRIINLVGSKSKITCQDLPHDDPRQRKPDIMKARHLIDFEPKISLDEGLGKTIENFKERLGLLS